MKSPTLLLVAGACLLSACGAHPAASNGSATNQSAAVSTDLPALTGRVVDGAELLTPQEEAGLTTELEGLERRTSDQFVIVTVTTLHGRDIADFGRELGNQWRIGQAGRNNGVLLIVAPAEHKVRIAVGDGLTSTLTNQEASDIIQRDLIPQFREGHWFTGIQAGSRAIISELAPAANDNQAQRR